MSREILFKAKRIDNGEWGEGQYAYITNPLTEDGKPIRHLICNGTNIFNDLIDPVTLCQFTGLHDNTKWGDLTEAEKESFLSDWNYREDRKNKIEDWSGRKIWENDILRYSYDYDGSPFLKDGEEIKYRVGAVFWSEWRGSWAVCGRGNKKCTNNDVFKYNRNPNRTEVIGNIFDNPELLEVE